MATTQLVTNNYRLHMAQQFINSFTGAANTIYYAYAGQATPSATTPTSYDNPQTTQFNAYNTMLFGKRLTPSDVALMTNYYPWNSGTVYAMYDDSDTTLSSKQFYVCVNQNSNYYVFKCLYNNKGAPSTYPPTFSDTAEDDDFYQTADGYQWKYMYKITSGDFKKFSTSLYIPVTPDVNVTANAINGAVDVIVTTSGGAGYRNYFSGKFNTNTAFVTSTLVQLANVVFANSSTSVYASTNNIVTPSTIAGLYDQCYLYITNGTGKGQYRSISSHSANTSGVYLFLESSFVVTPDSTSSFEITPRVVVKNATDNDPEVYARALINSTSNSVSSVQILSRGSNVFSATAFVYAAPTVGVTSNAVLQVITPPIGGHGANAAAELYSSRVGVSVTFANSYTDSTLPTYGSYSSVGLIKNPMFANVLFTTTSLNGNFKIGDNITQTLTDSATGLSVTAKAVVTKVNVGSLLVTNVSGTFALTSNATYGTILNSTLSANAWITAIENNGVNKAFSTFTQYHTALGNYSAGTFTSAEPVYQNIVNSLYPSNIQKSTAVFFANNSSGNTVYLTQKNGLIAASNSIVSGTLTGTTTGSIFTISTVTPPDLVQESGDVIYIENFPAVTRIGTQSETVKLILEY
jgi:hypothetical protein